MSQNKLTRAEFVRYLKGLRISKIIEGSRFHYTNIHRYVNCEINRRLKEDLADVTVNDHFQNSKNNIYTSLIKHYDSRGLDLPRKFKSQTTVYFTRSVGKTSHFLFDEFYRDLYNGKELISDQFIEFVGSEAIRRFIKGEEKGLEETITPYNYNMLTYFRFGEISSSTLTNTKGNKESIKEIWLSESILAQDGTTSLNENTKDQEIGLKIISRRF